MLDKKTSEVPFALEMVLVTSSAWLAESLTAVLPMPLWQSTELGVMRRRFKSWVCPSLTGIVGGVLSWTIPSAAVTPAPDPAFCEAQECSPSKILPKSKSGKPGTGCLSQNTISPKESFHTSASAFLSDSARCSL